MSRVPPVVRFSLLNSSVATVGKPHVHDKKQNKGSSKMGGCMAFTPCVENSAVFQSSRALLLLNPSSAGIRRWGVGGLWRVEFLPYKVRDRGRKGDKEGREHIIGIKPDASGLHRNPPHTSHSSPFSLRFIIYFLVSRPNNLIKAEAG